MKKKNRFPYPQIRLWTQHWSSCENHRYKVKLDLNSCLAFDIDKLILIYKYGCIEIFVYKISQQTSGYRNRKLLPIF